MEDILHSKRILFFRFLNKQSKKVYKSNLRFKIIKDGKSNKLLKIVLKLQINEY